MKLYRFALGIHGEADDLYTLALIPAKDDTEAFTKGCDLMPADAPHLARDYWRRNDDGDGHLPGGTDDAFFTVEQVMDAEDAARLSAEAFGDIATILDGYGE